jgi:tetratricopeptide (TPR) repeat protein
MSSPTDMFDQAFALFRNGSFREAEQQLVQLLQQAPEDFNALHLLGVIALQNGHPERAADLLGRAIRRNACVPAAHRHLATALRALKRPEEALASARRALALRPATAQAYLIQAAALADLQQFEAALESFNQAVALQPEDASAHNGRGSVLLDLMQPEQALLACERALALRPGFANALNNRGAALIQLAQFERALECFEGAIALDPEASDYRLNAAHAHLQLGRFESGWPLYASRPNHGPVHQQPEWQGHEQLTGKTLLLQSEQGLGDAIQFSRYVRGLEALGARVVLSIPARLRRLLQTHSATLRCVCDSDPAPGFDYHCRLLSVPLALGTTPASIPAAVPYLTAEPDRCALWRRAVGEEGFKIGVCWQGAVTRMDLGRSFPLAQLAPIARLPGVRLISLQKGAGTEQLRHLPGDMRIESLAEPFDDGSDAFVDTAAIMMGLDLIITSDTAIAHLAGALARPTWVALQQVPDWRWLLERSDTPWYPHTRLFRQTQRGNWVELFERMAAILRMQLAEAGAQ